MKKREMKNSGIKWIGDIPAQWQVIPHKYIMHKEKSICEQYNGEDIISLTMGGVIVRDLTAGGKMPTTFDGYQYVEPEDLLMCLFDIDVTPRCVGIVKNYGVTSPAYSRFKVHEGFHNAYYDYLLRFIDDEKVFIHLAKNLRSSLTETDFGAIKTVVPPLEEQKRISEFLDKQCAEIDDVVAKTSATIEEYKKLKQSIITDAVTKGVRGNRPMKDSGIEWIGDMPFDWEISRIKYVSEFEPSSDKNGLNEDSMITYTPMDCIKNGWFINQTAPLGSVASSLTAYQNGDIVMAKVTPCFENGNIAIMENLSSGYGLGSSELFVFRARSIETKFLFYWLRNDRFIQSACSTMTGTGGLKRVSPTFVKNCYLHLPPVEEQKEIADYLDKKCVEMDALITQKTALLEEMESYKKSVIYEYVTGKKTLS